MVDDTATEESRAPFLLRAGMLPPHLASNNPTSNDTSELRRVYLFRLSNPLSDRAVTLFSSYHSFSPRSSSGGFLCGFVVGGIEVIEEQSVVSFVKFSA